MMKSSGLNPVTEHITMSLSMRGHILPRRTFVMHERSMPVRATMSMSFRPISSIRFASFVNSFLRWCNQNTQFTVHGKHYFYHLRTFSCCILISWEYKRERPAALETLTGLMGSGFFGSYPPPKNICTIRYAYVSVKPKISQRVPQSP